MSEQPPSGEPPETPRSGPPPGGGHEPTGETSRRPVNQGAVVGGAVLGFVGSWVIFAFVYMALWGIYGDETSSGQVVIGLAGLLALPVVAGAFMISPRTRHAGAGLLMGVAIGSMVGAGVCGSTLGFGM